MKNTIDCKEYHNKPINCQSKKDCAYRKSSSRTYLGQCYNISKSKSKDKIKDSSRKRYIRKSI